MKDYIIVKYRGKWEGEKGKKKEMDRWEKLCIYKRISWKRNKTASYMTRQFIDEQYSSATAPGHQPSEMLSKKVNSWSVYRRKPGVCLLR